MAKQLSATWISRYYLLGDIDLERDRGGLRIGERLRLRLSGDLLGGLRGRLGGDLRGEKNIYTYTYVYIYS